MCLMAAVFLCLLQWIIQSVIRCDVSDNVIRSIFSSCKLRKLIIIGIVRCRANGWLIWTALNRMM